MSLRPFSFITIHQVPTEKWTGRNLIFQLDFSTEYSVSSNWESHTDNFYIKFPKNIRLFGTDSALFAYASGGYGSILGGSGNGNINDSNSNAFGADISVAPLIMKGDLITINHGYLFRNQLNQDVFCSTGGSNIFEFILNRDNSLSTPKDLFSGYVSSVQSDTPIEIKCEDNFYLLKKTPFDKTVWNKKESNGNTSLYGLMQHVLDLVNEKFNAQSPETYPLLTLLDVPNSITAKFSLGYLEIGTMTCAQLLDKLKQQYHFYSTFRGNVLQFGFPIYTDSDGIDSQSGTSLQANSKNFFCFNDIYNSSGQLLVSANIFPTHDLEYSNKDDIILSATVQCKVINKIPNQSTLSGKQKTKAEKLKVLVYWDISTEKFLFENISTGITPSKKFDGEEGERHEFWYPVDNSNPNPTIQNLVDLGIAQLKKYHYTGFRGCFTTFGFPYVEWNDNINIIDPIYSDRNGQYKVRKVIYKGGLKGLSQEIHLDYKIDVALPKSVKQISMI